MVFSDISPILDIKVNKRTKPNTVTVTGGKSRYTIVMSKKLYNYMGRPTCICLCRSNLDLILTRQQRSYKHKKLSVYRDAYGRYRFKVVNTLLQLERKSYEVLVETIDNYPCIILKDALLTIPEADGEVAIRKLRHKTEDQLRKELSESQCRIVQLEKQNQILQKKIERIES